jgi:chromosome segregation ATPase
MPDDVLQVLTRFHYEVVLPDVQRIVEDAIGTSVGSLRNEMCDLFDGMYVRMDRSESELAAVKAGLARVGARLDGLESRLTSVESELQAIKSRLAQLETRVAAIESHLTGVEEKIDQLATQPEIDDLKLQIKGLNGRVAKLEARR